VLSSKTIAGVLCTVKERVKRGEMEGRKGARGGDIWAKKI